MKASAELGERMAVIVRDHVERQLAPLRETIAELETRSAETMSFKGTFQAAQRYERGDLAICDGQLFYSLRDHDAGERKPGDAGSSGWTMIGKTR